MAAPIIVTVYNRLEHFKKCIESLKRGDLASDTVLYISSDAPYRQVDVEAIRQIRQYSENISGFKDVVFLFQRENKGCKRCTEEAFSKIFKENDKLISIEDDIIVSPDFLNFINDALDQYKENKRVYSVSAFSLSIFYPGMIKDEAAVYFTHRFNPWGYGIWRDRYLSKKDYKIKDLENSLKQSTFVKNLNKIGSDLYPAFLSAVAQKKMITLDYLNVYHMVKNDLVTVTPYRSKSFNIGNDGTGTRTKKSKRFTSTDLTFLNHTFNYFLTPEIDNNIDDSFNRVGHNYKVNKYKVIMYKLGLLSFGIKINNIIRGKLLS